MEYSFYPLRLRIANIQSVSICDLCLLTAKRLAISSFENQEYHPPSERIRGRFDHRFNITFVSIFSSSGCLPIACYLSNLHFIDIHENQSRVRKRISRNARVVANGCNILKYHWLCWTQFSPHGTQSPERSEERKKNGARI